jgi:plastocyanin domain-containing protein
MYYSHELSVQSQDDTEQEAATLTSGYTRGSQTDLSTDTLSNKRFGLRAEESGP